MDSTVSSVQTTQVQTQDYTPSGSTTGTEQASATTPLLPSGLKDLEKTLAALKNLNLKMPKHEDRCSERFLFSKKSRKFFEKIDRLLNSLTRLMDTFAKVGTQMPVGGSASTTTQRSTDSAQSPANQNTSAEQTPPADQSLSTDPTSPASRNQSSTPQPSDSTPQTDPVAPPTTTTPTSTTSTTKPTTTASISAGSLITKTGSFLWKPQSDSDGKLAVLLPPKFTGKVKELTILSPDRARVLGKGRYSGVGNGGREHYRFAKKGSAFPDGAIVLITLKDGTTQHVTIKDTAGRTTR